MGIGQVEAARRPLLRAARHLRIKAVELIPRLFGEVKRSAADAIDRIEHAKKLADSLK